MIAPMSVVSSSGSPIFKAASFSLSFARKDSTIERWRNSRDPAVHDWPWRVIRIPAITPSTVLSSSASGKTRAGLLPPSSSDTGTMRSAAACMMLLPTSVDPVKDSLRTMG